MENRVRWAGLRVVHALVMAWLVMFAAGAPPFAMAQATDASGEVEPSDFDVALGLPGVEDLPAFEGQEIWIDGEGLRYMLASLRAQAGEKVDVALDRLVGLRMGRVGEALQAGLYFTQSVDIVLKPSEAAARWEPYEIRLPKAVRLEARIADSVLKVTSVDRGMEALTLKLQMPWLPDRIWLRRATVDLSTGDFELEAGVIGNQLAVVAKGRVLERDAAGVDFWGSLLRNLERLRFRPAGLAGH